MHRSAITFAFLGLLVCAWGCVEAEVLSGDENDMAMNGAMDARTMNGDGGAQADARAAMSDGTLNDGGSDDAGTDGDAEITGDGAMAEVDAEGDAELVDAAGPVDPCSVDNGGCGPTAQFLCEGEPGGEASCRPFNLDDLWAGRAQFTIDEAQGQIGWNGFHFLSALWHDDLLYAYTIINSTVDDVNRASIALGVSEDAEDFDGRGVVLDIGGGWQWSYRADADEHHQTGRAEAGGWSASVNAHEPGYMAYGPYAPLPAGPMTVSFQLMVDVVDANDDVVVTLDVFDVTDQEILATRAVNRREFAAPFEYGIVNMEYTQQEGHVMEFRVFWHGSSYVRLGDRGVSQGWAPFVDQRLASFPGVWKEGETWYLVYECAGLTEEWPGDVCLSTSTDDETWIKSANNPILRHQGPGWEENNIGTPSLWVEDGTWYLFYHGFDGQNVQIGLASGPSLNALQRHPDNPLLPVIEGSWEAGTVGKRSIVREGDWYYMAYEGSSDQAFNPNSANPACQDNQSPDNPQCLDFGGADWSTGLARSADLINWERYPDNPILPTTRRRFGYDGAEFIRTPDGLLHLYYRAPLPNNQTWRATLSRSPM